MYSPIWRSTISWRVDLGLEVMGTMDMWMGKGMDMDMGWIGGWINWMDMAMDIEMGMGADMADMGGSDGFRLGSYLRYPKAMRLHKLQSKKKIVDF